MVRENSGYFQINIVCSVAFVSERLTGKPTFSAVGWKSQCIKQINVLAVLSAVLGGGKSIRQQ